MRSKSEPPATSRDSRRRRHFLMEDVQAETSYDDHFINPDLETRAQIFNSEHRVRAAPYRVGGRLTHWRRPGVTGALNPKPCGASCCAF